MIFETPEVDSDPFSDHCGAILAEHFSAPIDDSDELPNQLVTK